MVIRVVLVDLEDDMVEEFFPEEVIDKMIFFV